MANDTKERILTAALELFLNNGYASEAAKTVRNWVFRDMDYPTLCSCCKYTNVF